MYYTCIFIYLFIIFPKFSKNKDEKKVMYISIQFYSKFPYQSEKNYFYENITKNYLYSEIKLGSNEQNIEMKLELNYYETYILKNTLVNKQLYSPFETNSSKTFKTFDRFYAKYNEFSSGILSSDDLIIYNNSKDIKINNFYFAYVDNGFKSIPGSIGLSLIKKLVYPEQSMNFIDQLKSNNLINNYNFAFIFNNKNKEKNFKGDLYIGEDLNKIIPDIITKYNKTVVKSSQKSLNEDGVWALDINEVYLGNYEYKIDSGNIDINKRVQAQFDLKYDFIMATDEYSKMIYKIFFKNLFSSLKCYRESFVYYSYFYAVKCEKSIDIKSFPDLIFDFSSEFEKVNLILDYNDLFEIKGDFIYFKIILTWPPEENIIINENWIFGKVFFKIFLVNFNKERKDISIYYKEKTKKIFEENTHGTNLIFYLIIIIMIIMSGIIILLIVKFLKLKKFVKNRKRLNVLEVELTENKGNKNI